MSNPVNFFKLALDYYDNINNKYHKEISELEDATPKIETADNDIDDNIISFNIDGKKVKYRYELIGLFYIRYKVWMWSWIVPTDNKNILTTSHKMLNYALDIDKRDNDYSFILKTCLLNPRIRIYNKYQIDTNIAIYLYMSKAKLYYRKKVILNKNKDDYYYLYYSLFSTDQ